MTDPCRIFFFSPYFGEQDECVETKRGDPVSIRRAFRV
jgi:hypothetical protein